MKKIITGIFCCVLVVSAAGQTDLPPFGTLETPISGAMVQDNVLFSGWVIDDNGGVQVRIYRIASGSLVYVGTAYIEESLKPELMTEYPRPQYYGGGWQYEVQTRFLPDQGNGTYGLTALATDASGQTDTLGIVQIICDNANSVKPFGLLDTPVQGGIVTGDQYVIWGWALTNQPDSIARDGSTLNVYVDGANLGHPVYNIYRADIASLFPGYVNSNGGAGYFVWDMTGYEDGLHTVWWDVTDSGPDASRIGYRYFYIYNQAKIQISGNTAEITSGDTIPSATDGSLFIYDASGDSVTHDFVVKNLGAADLILGQGLNRVNVEGAGFTVSKQPSTPLVQNQSDTFSVTFDPSVSESASGTVTITSNDAELPLYTFRVKGKMITMPDIALTIHSQDIADSTMFDFGEVAVGSDSTVQFIIENLGNDTLKIDLPVYVTDGYLEDFPVLSQPVSAILPGASSSFQVGFSPLYPRPSDATLVVESNDPDENPYVVFLTGTGVEGTDVREHSRFPEAYSLSQNYPNPFNPVTAVQYAVLEMQDVQIVVYDMLGNRVAILLDKKQKAGYYTAFWDGRDENGMPVSSGIYLIRMRAGNYAHNRKCLLVR